MTAPSIDELFARAMEFSSPDERRRFARDACGENGLLLAELESLLAASEASGDFLHPAQTAVLTRAGAPDAITSVPKITGFRIERVLGEGALGMVYAAWDEKLHRKVALKVLHAMPDSETRGRIVDEARKAAALRDPGIVTVHAVLDEHDPPAIVMELVEGFPIDRFAGSLTFDQKGRVLQEIARALSCAHERGIIHRDLKPGNVLLTPGMQPVILDFGLALSFQDATQPKRGFEGTPLYASPEQVQGEPLSGASDVFSLGTLMFKFLTGRNPFDGPDLAGVLRAILVATPPFPRDVATDVPEDLQAICLACLAKNPAERPSADAVAIDLGRFLAGEPARLRPALYGDILRRRISEHAGDLASWEKQGMISHDERDRIAVVHRRILSDEDHWLVDARRLTLAGTILYSSIWTAVVAAGLLVWLARDEVPAVLRWLAPLFSSLVLIGVGSIAERRREALASASFLAGAVLSLVPCTLSVLAEVKWLNAPTPGVQQLFAEGFTNQQVMVSCVIPLVLSIMALRRLRLTGLAWTTCALGATSYLAVLIQFNWLDRKPELQALWLLPLVSFAMLALRFETVGRVRWALPFHLVALVVLVGALDVMAVAGPTAAMLGLDQGLGAFFDEERQRLFSFAGNGLAFLLLMRGTERARSLDLRRGSRVLEALGILHLLGALYQNAQVHRTGPFLGADVAIYWCAVVACLVVAARRSSWRMLVGALGGVALGSYLLLDLNLISKGGFALGLGAAGLSTAMGAYVYLRRAPQPRRGSNVLKSEAQSVARKMNRGGDGA